VNANMQLKMDVNVNTIANTDVHINAIVIWKQITTWMKEQMLVWMDMQM
jgi:hypothetical protein